MKTVDEYAENLPDERKEICLLLREMIFENVPGVEEKLSFKIPFYHYYGMFMYLNNTPKGINVAFCRGKDLVIAFPQLMQKDRAMVATVTIEHKKQIREKNIRELIVAAAAWNEEAKRLRIPMVKRTNRARK
jgi:uncharacterized protein